MPETLVGRCPARGCEIYSDPAAVPPTLRFTCQDPGRADGVYAAALGLVPTRGAHPSVVTADRPDGEPGRLEAVTGFVAVPQAAALVKPEDVQAHLTAAAADMTVEAVPASPASLVTP